MLARPTYYLFTDASFDSASKLASCGVLLLDKAAAFGEPASSKNVVTKFIKQTGCSGAEVCSAIYGLGIISDLEVSRNPQVYLITDSTAVQGLVQRRPRLEKNNFLSRSSGKPLKNAEVYREFYQVYDQVRPEMILLKGHRPKHQRDPIEKQFAIVDQRVRKELRTHLRSLSEEA